MMDAPSATERVHGSARLRRRQTFARVVMHPLGRVRVAGLENVPERGPVIVAVNHRSILDGFLLFGLVARPANFLVKVEAFTPGVGAVLRSAGQIPVRRDVVDAAAVRAALRILRDGGVVGIFPEGTRGDGLVRTARPGVGWLALRSGAAVVPVACHGVDHMSHRASWRRPRAWVTVGEPVTVDRFPDTRPLPRRLVLAETERVRATLATLVADTAERPTAVAA